MARRARTLLLHLMIAGSLALLAFLAGLVQSLNDFVQPAFVAPYLGATLMSGNPHSINSVAFGSLLVLEFYLVVVVFSWLAGHFRSESPAA